jgi:protocatechuate 3,4-dioxygenase beta subunit
VKASREIVVERGQSELRVDLELRHGKVRVQVVAQADGKGLQGAQVELVPAGTASGPRPQRRMMMIGVAMNDNGAGESMTMTLDGARAKTDADGVAVIDDVPPGTYTVRVRHDAHVPRQLADQVVVEFATTDCPRVELSVAGRIRGRVLGADGQPVGMALVRYRRADGSGEDGREPAMGGAFTLRGLAPGRYALRAEQLGPENSPQGAEVQVDVVAGETAGGVELRTGSR